MLSAILDFGATIISSLVTYLLIAWLSPGLLPENWRDPFAKDDNRPEEPSD